jgi:hypothetical protein
VVYLVVQEKNSALRKWFAFVPLLACSQPEPDNPPIVYFCAMEDFFERLPG